MDKIPALIISILIVFLVFADIAFLKTLAVRRESVVIDNVIDGDTLRLRDGRTIRLLNINAPEKSSDLSHLSIEFMKSFQNKSVSVEITGQDKYDRYLARLYSNYYVNLELVKQGLASIFMVEDSELKLFFNAEDEAVARSKGIWRKSEYYGCISASVDAEKEFVIIRNLCSINMDDWEIKDESRKIFTFPNINQEIIILHSGIGGNNSTDLFWNSKTNIWNDDRDTIYIFDNSSKIAHHYSYGY